MDFIQKPNLQLASFVKELLDQYDQNRHDEILNNLSQKWSIPFEDAEFCLEAINSKNFQPILANMGVSATYDKNFLQVFRAMDYLNGKIDEHGNLKTVAKNKSFIFGIIKKNFGWIFIVVITLVFVFFVRLLINYIF